MRNNTNNLHFPNHVTPATAAILAQISAPYNGLRPILVVNNNLDIPNSDTFVVNNNLNIPNPNTSVVNNNSNLPTPDTSVVILSNVPDTHPTPLIGTEEQHTPTE